MFKTKNKTTDFPKQTFVFDDAELHEKGCYWQWFNEEYLTYLSLTKLFVKLLCSICDIN